MRLDREEALRYLGYGGAAPDPRTKELLESCAEEIESLSTIRVAHRVYPDLTVEGDAVRFGGVSFQSRDLARTLSGCTGAVVLCATLGAQADRIRARASRTDLARATVLDAAQSAYIEQVCDRFCASFRESGEAGGMSMTARYSPGYGDFPISCQPMLLALADATRRIGLTCGETFMLMPQKSVTAVIGLTAGEPRCGEGGEDRCRTCENRFTCRYGRRSL